MTTIKQELKDDKRYLSLLAREYPNIQAACTEIINLQAILNLPKGTEHFISDLHGEYDACCHILNNCSGVIRDKIDAVYSDTITERERADIPQALAYASQLVSLKMQTPGPFKGDRADVASFADKYYH